MMKCTVLLAVLFIVSAVTVANDPSHGIPWPVGSLELMDEAKPLMNGYGDRCNGRDKFHTGIDIDDCTEPDSGNRVRCVEDGFIAKMWDQGESSGWSVIVTPTPESQYGWCYTHLENPSEEWEEDEEIYEGDLIDTMNVHGAMETHLHFSWINRNEIETSLVNPLDYLVNEPEGSDYWEFNPDELTPEFKHMFLPEYWAYEWPTQYPNTDSVEADIIPDDDLSGDVDFFFGVTLQAGDISTDEKIYVDCVPERVYWELIRETESGSDVLSTNYVVNFDCALTNDDETAKMFTFYWLMFNLFGGNKAGFMCLTNCGEIQGWESLGIGNIKENSWVTDKHYNQMPVAPTINPVLAEYPDGSYSIDVTCFAHVNDVVPTPNPEVTFDVSIPCELHNFSPALRKVSILDAATDQTYYHAKWVPNDLSADLNVSVDNPASAEAELQVILIFTEEMNTSSLSAILGPLSVGNGVWSGTVVSNDTWTGEVTLPSDEGDGTYILFVSASDIDGMGLMDPEGAG
ncbi:MAG: hypothetical protein GQ565_10870, partial [Candidatus Aegiribacteria sp.]|nr:hypothetical protein [Candidatus Aegiribacteria sp.]